MACEEDFSWEDDLMSKSQAKQVTFDGRWVINQLAQSQPDGSVEYFSKLLLQNFFSCYADLSS